MFGQIRFKIANQFHSSPKKVLINSLPKSGTHLLSSILLQIPGIAITGDLTDLDKGDHSVNRTQLFKEKTSSFKEGIWVGHMPYSTEMDNEIKAASLKTIFIYRDPRAVVTSLAHYVESTPHHPYFNILKNYNHDEKLRILIEGFGNGKNHYELNQHSIPSLLNYTKAYIGWLESQHVLAISFESLIGNKQHETLTRICEHLNLTGTTIPILKRGIGNRDSYTFRKADIDSWKSELNENHQAIIQKQFLNQESNKMFYNEKH
jgi:hypothetical protein